MGAAGKIESQGNGLAGATRQHQVGRLDHDAESVKPTGQQATMFQVSGGWGVEIEMIGVDPASDAGQGPRQETARQHGGWHIGRKIDQLLPMCLQDGHERCPTLDAAHQTPSFQGGIGFRHRTQADPQLPGELPVGGETVATFQSSFNDVVGQGIYQAFRCVCFDVREAGCPGRLKAHCG
ncbi:hypothetical protein QZH46_02275 [Pseudomonas corrugata]